MRPGLHVVLTLRLGADLHALPVSVVEEVLPALPIEPITDAPGFLRGVVFVRGHLIPVVDAAERLNRKDGPRKSEPQIVCVRAAGRLLGLEVDEAVDLVDVQGAETLPVAEVMSYEGAISSLIEREGHVIRLLDPERLLAPDEAARLSRVPKTAPRPSASA